MRTRAETLPVHSDATPALPRASRGPHAENCDRSLSVRPASRRWLIVAALFVVTYGVSTPLAAYGVFLPGLRRDLRVEPRGDLGGAVGQSAARRRRRLRDRRARRSSRPPGDAGRDGDSRRRRLRAGLHGQRAVAALSARRRLRRHRHVELLSALDDDRHAVVRCASRPGPGARPRRLQPRLHLGRAAVGVAHRERGLADRLRSARDHRRRRHDAGGIDGASARVCAKCPSRARRIPASPPPRA